MSPERQQSSYPAAAHAVFAGFSCQPEEEMDNPQAEKDRKSQGEDEEEWE